ncbi:MAG TPA: dockerin type I repeat-containing protein [Polyangiaceae bacterium]
MNNQLKLGLACVLILGSVDTAMAAEPGQIVIRQVSNNALVTHPVAGDINLFAAYIQPASYAYGGGEQFNVDIRYNMNGAPWADSYAVNCSVTNPPCNVGAGAEWTTNDDIYIVQSSQVPIMLRFDAAYGSHYVLVVDRAMTDIAVKVAGDVDGDGVLTTEDANMLLEAAVGLTQLSRIESAVADVNCDNTVNVNDALKVARAAAGLEVLGCQ